jgi:hypothetical protein
MTSADLEKIQKRLDEIEAILHELKAEGKDFKYVLFDLKHMLQEHTKPKEKKSWFK